VNTIAANYTCKGGKIASFKLDQSAPSAALPTLREQRVQVATFKLEGGMLALAKNAAVTYSGARTAVPALVGSPCPDLVYPNYEDWGFAKVQLDQRSFNTARAHLANVSDPLLRTMLWQSLWDGVRDGKLPLNEFIATALHNAPAEKDYTLLGDVLGKVQNARRLLDGTGIDTPATRKAALDLETMAWTGVAGSTGDFQRRWLRTWLNLAGSTAAQQRMAGLLDGSQTIAGLTINQDVRWEILQQLSRRDYPGSAALVASEAARDKSAAGQAAALAAEVMRPDAATKAHWLALVQDQKTTLPFSKIRVAMNSLYPSSQAALAEATAGQRLAQLPVLDQSAGPVYMRAYASALIPAGCTPASVTRLTSAAASMTGLSALTRRSLLNTLEEDQRCVAIKHTLQKAR
jgi:aminopeptidase N